MVDIDEINEMNEKQFMKEQDGNDKICLFCGAKLSLDGTKWIFDEPGTEKLLMKCPPFGLIQRCTNTDAQLETRIMRFNDSYDWLMIAIKECSKNTTTPDLKQKYKFIKFELTNFSYIGCIGNINLVHQLVVEFIDECNRIKQEII